MGKGKKHRLYKHHQLPNGVWTTKASTPITKGTCIFMDEGLICLPSDLPNNEQSAIFLEKRLANMTEAKQNVFRELSNFHDAKTHSAVYGRYRTHAIVIRHTPQYSGIFPTLSKVRNSCAPNAVSAVFECLDKDPRKDWVLALQAARDIEEGEEITRFSIKGGGGHKTRNAYHLEQFGYGCSCSCCSLKGAQRLASDSRRLSIAQLRAQVVQAAEKGVSTGPLRPGHIKGMQRFLAAIHSCRRQCEEEGILDHSLWFLYGQAALITFRFGISPEFWRFFECLMDLDVDLLGVENPIHRDEVLQQFWLHDVEKRLTKAEADRSREQISVSKLWECHTSMGQDLSYKRRINDFTDTRFFLRFGELPFSTDSLSPEDNVKLSEDDTMASRVTNRAEWFDEAGQPKKAWCMLAELMKREEEGGSRWLMRDTGGNYFAATVSSNSFAPYYPGGQGLESGCTVALWFSVRTQLPDGRIGIKCENGWKNRALRDKNLKFLMDANEAAVVCGGFTDDGIDCAVCHKRMSWSDLNIRHCPVSRVFWYCSALCQDNCGQRLDLFRAWLGYYFLTPDYVILLKEDMEQAKFMMTKLIGLSAAEMKKHALDSAIKNQ